ncbi:hypothetical protein RVBP17_3190 [Pseudomonas phage sp. 30-3]|nr:hypothetical protein GBBBJNDB_00263 [Pseudomonas phage Callisto]WPK39427.1 hypothetical protein Deiofobo_0230 [Pseudomonas phage Deifobo]WPK39940.1 hypothetical protein ETTORE_0231 [Pseudomonas phage Ettore]WPK40460.1 hypothetical protein Paride_0230 [Pseudomonas phage Paride]VOH55198.1 hypothetical protein MIJ3_00262 [Pseudomonas phage vB_PaeM_MIJ3]BDR25636.1 hypothetical protein RVBP16_0760 [Pseudomonas phage sp. 30-2]BDR26276.1 hypothetical protein RVBP17_3190 [Pseudomonas phage sp. 30-
MRYFARLHYAIRKFAITCKRMYNANTANNTVHKNMYSILALQRISLNYKCIYIWSNMVFLSVTTDDTLTTYHIYRKSLRTGLESCNFSYVLGLVMKEGY